MWRSSSSFGKFQIAHEGCRNYDRYDMNGIANRSLSQTEQKSP